jgi:hypothetical protein
MMPQLPTAAAKFAVDARRYPENRFARWFWAVLELVAAPLTLGSAVALDRTGIEVRVVYLSTGDVAAAFRYPATQVAAAEQHMVTLRQRLDGEPLDEFCSDLGIWPVPTS